MIENCTALILAGGESKRMGQDKTMLVLDGQTLLQHVVARMQAFFPQVLVSVREHRSDVREAQVPDERPGTGPLAGLCAGMARARTPWVFAVGADMPFLGADLISMLAARRDCHQAVVPIINGYPQPLTAFFACSALPVVEAVLAGPGKRSLRELLDRLDVCRVDEAICAAVDPGLQSFIDLDTPADLAALKSRR